MQHGAMSNRAALANCQRIAHIRVHGGMFLNVGVATDANQLVVAAQYYAKPDIRVFTEEYLADNGSVRRYPIGRPMLKFR